MRVFPNQVNVCLNTNIKTELKKGCGRFPEEEDTEIPHLTLYFSSGRYSLNLSSYPDG
jgi:hypothetical protein